MAQTNTFSLSREELKEFKAMLREDWPDFDFTDKEALGIATNLLVLMQSTYARIPRGSLQSSR